MDIPTISYLNEQGELSSSCMHKVPNEKLIKIYKKMSLTRYVDDRMITLQRQGLISFAMSSRGEEACSVVTASALELVDWLYPQYREVGIMFWRGCTAQEYIHHMFSNAKDFNKGKQMPNHFGSKDLNVVTVSSPLATQLPHAAGAAYVMKLEKEQAVTLAFFGEGTSSKEDFHAALNFAAVRKVPAIYFCRNNGYAISTQTKDQFIGNGVASRGVGYGMLTYRVDGNDVFALHDTVQKAREECLKGNGPVLIEAMTYRLGGHSTSDDPSAYRKDEEVEKWEKKCPLLRLRRYLEKAKLWSLNKEEALTQSISEEVEAAIKEAKDTEPPELESVFTDVYFDVPEALKEQLNEVEHFFGKES